MHSWYHKCHFAYLIVNSKHLARFIFDLLKTFQNSRYFKRPPSQPSEIITIADTFPVNTLLSQGDISVNTMQAFITKKENHIRISACEQPHLARGKAIPFSSSPQRANSELGQRKDKKKTKGIKSDEKKLYIRYIRLRARAHYSGLFLSLPRVHASCAAHIALRERAL